MIDAGYIYFQPADLQALKTSCLACLQDNFTAHQSYTIAGRTITRANIGQVSAILASVNYAIEYQSGKIKRTAVANFSRCR